MKISKLYCLRAILLAVTALALFAATGALADPAPGGAAKIGAWNSCYNNQNYEPKIYEQGYRSDGCIEQWGSYPAACSKYSGGRVNVPGKRCQNVCGVGECSSGECYNNYDYWTSNDFAASYYSCS